jgi:hypothetical protein
MTMTLAPLAPPVAPPPVSAPRPRLRRISYEPEPGVEVCEPPPLTPPGPPVVEPTSPQELADAHAVATRILRLALEVLDRRRPSQQLAGHVAANVLRYWKVAVHQRQIRSPARFTRIRLCMPCDGVAEVGTACYLDGQVRALAARFERGARGWRCTALRLI